jgi:hypothetical protein
MFNDIDVSYLVHINLLYSMEVHLNIDALIIIFHVLPGVID